MRHTPLSTGMDCSAQDTGVYLVLVMMNAIRLLDNRKQTSHHSATQWSLLSALFGLFLHIVSPWMDALHPPLQGFDGHSARAHRATA